jgi:hypothetical protein
VSLAERLIAATRTEQRLPVSLRNALQKLLKHNDKHPWGKRVPAESAIKMLSDAGYPMARQKFDRLIAREFGRKWGSQ